ncbi:HAD family phosphatase, partial [Melissococcus plutonius]
YQAGIPVIMIPDLIKPTAEIEKMTVAILDSLLQVPAYLTENLKTKNNKIEA